MQRVLHSICTARILLNLRKAANEDRAWLSEIPTDSDSDSNTRSRENHRAVSGRQRTALSSVILGVDTWFRDTRTYPIDHMIQTDTETTF